MVERGSNTEDDVHFTPQFGDALPQRTKKLKPAEMFPEGEDLPIFSGTPIDVIDSPFTPEDQSFKQQMLPDMPPVDYGRVLANDKALQRRRSTPALEQEGTLWTYEAPEEAISHEQDDVPPADDPRRRHLHEALEAYNLNLEQLRQLVALGTEINQVLRSGNAPPEVLHMMTVLSHLLTPAPREQIKSPVDAAAVLMVEMGHLDQEELRTVLLDTRNRIQAITTVYKGSLNASMVRVGEVFKEAIRHNSAALIVAHNHPSGEPTPSPEDVLVTREIRSAGELLDINVLDHLVIGQGRWTSMREKGLGFDS